MKAPGQFRQFFCNYLFHARILQPYSIEHSGLCFRYAGQRIADTLCQSRTFERKGPQAVDIIEIGEFITITEGTGGGDDRVLQLDTAEADA